MYAIVDIETTGGYAANNDITEVAIVLHDGATVTGRYETLIKPNRPIPYFIQRLTGITNEMVAVAPRFEEIAGYIQSLLEGRIFLAHNVNFDYSFLSYHLKEAGYELKNRKVCTVRLCRKVFPGLPSYSLGNLCRHFHIPIVQRHRAGGDVDATALLFEQMLRSGGQPCLEQLLKRSSREQSLPPHLSREQVDQLPYTPGVYYFHDQKDKVIYVGKARNLKYRVCSHFTHNGAGRQRQEFLRHVYRISYRPCSTELMAFILESIEIRRLWPAYNTSLKRFTPVFGLYMYEDQNGYLRLAIEKQKKTMASLYTFNLLIDGQRLLRKLVNDFALCPQLCHLERDYEPCSGLSDHTCKGACRKNESTQDYNRRVREALITLDQALPSFALVDSGQHPAEQSCILVEKGRFYGMGYLPSDNFVASMENIRDQVTPYPETDYIRGLVYQFADKYPEKKIVL
jgi:DNA polymerase-3 subunit epsilon